MIRKDTNTRTKPTTPQRLTPEQLRQIAGGATRRNDGGRGRDPQTN